MSPSLLKTISVTAYNKFDCKPKTASNCSLYAIILTKRTQQAKIAIIFTTQHTIISFVREITFKLVFLVSLVPYSCQPGYFVNFFCSPSITICSSKLTILFHGNHSCSSKITKSVPHTNVPRKSQRS